MADLEAINSGGTLASINLGGTAAGNAVMTKDDVATDIAGKRDLTDSDFGSSSDITTFESTGHMEMQGAATVWEDVNLDPTMLTGNGTLPVSVTFGSTGIKVASFVNNKSDNVFACREYPHKGKLNAAGETSVILSFHAHAHPQDTAGGNVRLFLEYFFATEGDAVTTSTTIYLTGAVPTTAWERITFEFADIPTPEELGAQFHFRFGRLGSDALDTYTGDLAVSTIGFHYEADGVGSRQILTK